MALSIKFSDVSGENVSLTRERNSASWKHLYSGGMVFSQLPLKTGKRVKLTVRGSSIVHVGFYNGNPSDVTNIKELHLNKKIDLIAQLDVYKKKCSAHLEKTVSSFTYICEDIPYTKNISPGTNVWVAVYIQFGDACVRLHSETESMKPMQFHTTHGKNIEFLDNTRTTAKLHIQNPAATSCIVLNPTEKKAVSVTLRLTPCMSGIKKYGLFLLASHSNAKLLRTFNEYMFMTDSKIQQQQRCTSIQSFERKSGKFNTCDGELTIKVEYGGKVKYHHDSAGSGSAQLTEKLSQPGGITLVLDMLRVTVDVIDACEYDAGVGSDDEECSSMSSVNSTCAISSCLQRSLHSPTGTTPLIRKELAEGVVDDSSSTEKTGSSTRGLSHALFTQQHTNSKKDPSTAKDNERLDAWVQETTRFNDRSVKKTEEKVLTEVLPLTKRRLVSPLAESEVQPKRTRTHNERKTEQETPFSFISSTKQVDNVKIASERTQRDTYCDPRSTRTEIDDLDKTIKRYNMVSSVQKNEYRNTQQHSKEQSDLSIVKIPELKRTSPAIDRLESIRSLMGIPVTLSMKTVSDDIKRRALVSRRPGRTRELQHQMTFISSCLQRSLHSPTGTTPLIRKELAEGVVDDSSSTEKTGSSTRGLSHALFTQPHTVSKKDPSTAKDERLDAWVQQATRFNDRSVKKTEEKVLTEVPPLTKRRFVSPLAESEVQPKRTRTHNERKAEQGTSFPIILSSGQVNNVKLASERTQRDMCCDPIASHTEIDDPDKTNNSYDNVSSVQKNEFQNTQQHSKELSDLSIEKIKDFKYTSPATGRLESMRSQMGIRVTPPMRTASDEVERRALVSRQQGRTRPIQHQMTYPNLSTASDNSELFYDDYRVALQQKATTQHYLKEKIKQNYTTLVKQLVVVPLVDFLYEADILAEDEHDRFLLIQQSFSANRELLGKLRQKPVNKDKFEAALRDAKLDHLIEMFI
ncbi:uncharacterized protein LOC117315786 [Pecten maximus]|uniref:uncharacterized protein LOC117315786 n=1 Tax=Pecten maximus TaxID=6579 RepID=UPI001458037B|nr:uncharacterized protein LOC117315786 [Pecten maximus]